MNPTLKLVKKNRDEVLSVAELLYGDGAWEISKALTQTSQPSSRKQNVMRGAAIAGTAAGAALGVTEVGHGLRGVTRAGGTLNKLATKIPKMPGGPKTQLGVASTMLGADILATNELKKPKQPKVPEIHKRLRPVATAEKVSKTASPEVEWRGEISKMDEDKRQVFGWASIVEVNGEPVVDLQGDYLSLDEIEKAAYNYVRKSRVGGNQHQKGVHVSDMIESFLVTPEKKQQMGLPADTPTGWWVGFQVNDDSTWQQVKNGERREFSIHGSGVRKDVEV